MTEVSMTKILLKKQMMEVFSWVYQNKKTGKNRTKNSIIGFLLLYILLFGFLGVVFGLQASVLCEPMLAVDMGWLYWTFMGLLGIFLGTFGSVFNTYSSLYQAKDNDLLLSMPIPPPQILIARLAGVYAMGLMYELIVLIPTMIIWFINAPFSLIGTIDILLIAFLLSLFILVLSAILGWVVAIVGAKVKHKNIITLIISLVFFAGYYYVCGSFYSIMENLLLNIETIGGKVKILLYPFYQMGLAAEGNILSMLIFTVIIIVLTAGTYLILSHSFLRLAISSSGGSAKAAYKERKVKVTSAQAALLRKEFQRFTSSANYMLNCGLGIILMPLSAIALIWKADVIRELVEIPVINDYVPLLAVASICTIAAMNDMVAPSISLEGKNLWIAQSLPVQGRQALIAKLQMQLLLTWIPAIPLIAAIEWLTKPNLFFAILIPLAFILFSTLLAEVGLLLNLKMPNLYWTSEIVPIKQSTPVTATLFGGWLIIVAFAGIYFLLRNVLNASIFLMITCFALFAAAGLSHHWIMTKGSKIFESL